MNEEHIKYIIRGLHRHGMAVSVRNGYQIKKVRLNTYTISPVGQATFIELETGEEGVKNFLKSI